MTYYSQVWDQCSNIGEVIVQDLRQDWNWILGEVDHQVNAEGEKVKRSRPHIKFGEGEKIIHSLPGSPVPYYLWHKDVIFWKSTDAIKRGDGWGSLKSNLSLSRIRGHCLFGFLYIWVKLPGCHGVCCWKLIFKCAFSIEDLVHSRSGSWTGENR